MSNGNTICPPIAKMAWRIGDILDIHEQFDWIEASGFDGVGFHAHAGAPGQWRGVEPATCGEAERQRLRERLSAFAFVEIHAPFALTLAPGATSPIVDGLAPVLAFAGDVGATVVTVHGNPPLLDQVEAPWLDVLARLNALASENGVLIGIETTANFATIRNQALPQIGVTLDVGHMYCNGRKPLDPFGSIGAVVRDIGPAMVHLHLHDVREGRDHVEIGTGEVDFADLLAALKGIGFERTLCLELNPDAVTPEAMQRSLAAVRRGWDAVSPSEYGRPGS